jgi:hypothetical protein
MNSFYSILYIQSEAVSDEKISVGLFLNTGEQPLFDFSERKLKVVSKLIGADATESIERLFGNLKKKTASVSENENQKEAFELTPFKESYFNYLNRYSNNLLSYSDPSANRGDFRGSDYNELFRLLIDKNYNIPIEKKKSFKDSVKQRIRGSVIEEKTDTFYKIPKEQVESIYRDHTVDYIGANGSIISGNSVDMKGNSYNLENKFNLLRVLANGLINLARILKLEEKNTHIVYYNEPEGKNNKELLYSALHDQTTPLTFKHLERFEEDEKWITENDIGKFSEFTHSR